MGVDLAHHEIFRAKVGKGGIMLEITCRGSYVLKCPSEEIFTEIILRFL